MPIKPESRKGKGSFEDPVKPILDDSFAETTVKKASSNIVVFDFLYMLIVGFIKTIAGFFGISDKISDKDKQGEI